MTVDLGGLAHDTECLVLPAGLSQAPGQALKRPGQQWQGGGVRHRHGADDRDNLAARGQFLVPAPARTQQVREITQGRYKVGPELREVLAGETTVACRLGLSSVQS